MKKSWYGAREHCQALGGDLASLHSQHKNDQILNRFFTLVSYYRHFFIKKIALLHKIYGLVSLYDL